MPGARQRTSRPCTHSPYTSPACRCHGGVYQELPVISEQNYLTSISFLRNFDTWIPIFTNLFFCDILIFTGHSILFPVISTKCKNDFQFRCHLTWSWKLSHHQSNFKHYRAELNFDFILFFSGLGGKLRGVHNDYNEEELWPFMHKW